MDGLAGTHLLCLELRHGIERGDSVLITLKNILPDLEIGLGQELRNLILEFEKSRTLKTSTPNQSIYRKSLLILVFAAMNGEPILKKLIELEKEIVWACEENIEQFISQLPLKIMLPILLLQFPAFLILLLGPILARYMGELSI